MTINSKDKNSDLMQRSPEARELKALIDVLQKKYDEYIHQITIDHLKELENTESTFNRKLKKAYEKSEAQVALLSVIEKRLSFFFDQNILLNAKLDDCERDYSLLKNEVTSLKRKFNQVIDSKSWRYTKYFRKVLATMSQSKYEPLELEEISDLLKASKNQKSIELHSPHKTGLLKGSDKKNIIKLNLPIDKSLNNKPVFDPDQEYTNKINSFEIANPLLSRLQTTPLKIDLTVSVIIPTFNAGEEFETLLLRLQSQNQISGLEIVIVDSGSTDNTLNIASAHKCEIINISQTSFSHSYARNLGAKRAKGDLLLFIVQDASPIGPFWINALVDRLQSSGVEALSASEFCNFNTDIIYALGVDTQYKFLGCWDRDRLGKLKGMDPESLRKNGQLSDLTLLIKRSLFKQFQYKGDYGEDLTLGVDLIKSGYQSLFLSSIKVIHSHYRSSWYYFKRGFVDINFLKSQFSNLDVPKPSKIDAIFTAIVRFHNCLSLFLYTSKSQYYLSIDDYFKSCISFVEQEPELGNTHFTIEPIDKATDDMIIHLRSWIDLNQCYIDDIDYKRFKIELINRIMHLKLFVIRVYEGAELTKALRYEITESLAKVFASHAGMFIGYTFKSEAIDQKMKNYKNLKILKDQLIKGV